MSSFAHPEVLVTTEWLAENLSDPKIRIIESNEDLELYGTGHIPGAIQINWRTELNDPLVRDYLNAERFAALMESKGISNDTTLVFYGDKNNWWATYSLWVFKLFGHADARILDGGRKKWEAEGRPLTQEVPEVAPGSYKVTERDDKTIRAFREDVLAHLGQPGNALVDVRSAAEFSGEKLHMPEYPQEGALRGGHIPGAKNIPWATAVNEDGTFKSHDELREIYEAQGFTADKDIISYCRIGERSSHSWFVLTYLLGYPNVRNYDGSWTEWGNLVNSPIEK
ncbi:MAG: sulfurtransferase [Anaerolineales bacterium]|nr:MAG: sulfurtransferase [Anaerolineales bacterium]